MNTADHIALYITAFGITLFYVIGVVALVYVLKFIKVLRRVVEKAEGAIDSVEAAADTVKNIGENASGPLAAFKVLKNIVDLMNRHK